MYKTFTRRELYDLVWSKPMMGLAKEYGISDRGLAKICDRTGIPVPPPGYWAKKVAGKKIFQPPLMLIAGDFDGKIAVPEKKKIKEDKVPEPVIEEPLLELEMPESLRMAIDYAKDSTRHPFIVPKTLDDPHSIIARWLEREERDKKSFEAWHSPYSKSKFQAKYASATAKRRLRILSTFFKICKLKGFSVYEQKDEKDVHDTICISIGGNRIKFYLEEPTEVVKRKLTLKEMRRENYIGSEPIEISENQPTGVLVFKMWGCEENSFEHEWKDEPDKQIEQQLNNIMVATLEGLWIVHRRRLVRVEQEREAWVARQKVWDEEKRQEKKAEIRKLVQQTARRWKDASDIRDFVQSIQQMAGHEEIGSEESSIGKWVQLALTAADEIDPLQAGLPLSDDFDLEEEDEEEHYSSNDRNSYRQENWFRKLNSWPRKKF